MILDHLNVLRRATGRARSNNYSPPPLALHMPGPAPARH